MNTLLTILRPLCQSGMNLSLKKCLILILQAMIVAWSVNILKLASEFASSAGVASVVRRIERFLLRGLIKQHEAARSIIDALPEKGRFILSMDGTSWRLGKFKYYVLAVGICFNGIASDMLHLPPGTRHHQLCRGDWHYGTSRLPDWPGEDRMSAGRP